MTQTLDPHYWQEQEQRANEIRPIMEQVFALAQQYGWVSPTIDDCWQYQGDEHTLVYDPDSDALWVEANTDTWRINFHEQVFVPEADTQITEEQLQDFRDLRSYLEQQSVSDTADLRAVQQAAQQQWQQVHNVTTDELDSLTGTAEQLFEHYAAQGEAAYQRSNTTYCYQLTVEDDRYILSRDDATGTYNVQREGAAMALANGQGVTQHDIQAWAAIGSWLTKQQQITTETMQHATNGWEETYWSQQEDRANVLLPIAEQAFNYHERRKALALDEQSYVTNIDSEAKGYEIGYAPTTDTLWIRREETVIVAAVDYQQNYVSDTGRWQLAGLSHLGEISQPDVEYFQSLQAWLQVKENQSAQQSTLSSRGMIESARAGRSETAVGFQASQNILAAFPETTATASEQSQAKITPTQLETPIASADFWVEDESERE